jgi:hypothetical protein
MYLQVDRILAAFARDQMQRVASKCHDDVRLVTFSTNVGQSWDDGSFLYRTLVYNNALADVHPSRFYQLIPLCEVRPPRKYNICAIHTSG